MAAKTETTPRKLQVLTIAVLGGTYALQWALTLSTVLSQLQYNSNLSSYLSFFIGQVVVPIVFFAIAFILNPRRISKVGKVFESLIIMLIGQMIMQWVVQGAMVVQQAFPSTNPNDAYANIVFYDLTAVVITAALYVLTLVCLRHTKRWK